MASKGSESKLTTTVYTNVDPDPNEIITCPYNPSHQIQHYKMQFHIEKCRKHYKFTDKVTCPLDATHIIQHQELNYHLTVCPSRKMFDTQAYDLDNGEEFEPPVERVAVDVCGGDENWDEDTHTSYERTTRAPHVLHKIKGATPSERRKFRSECVRNYKEKQ